MGKGMCVEIFVYSFDNVLPEMSSKSTGLDVTALRAVVDVVAARAQATYYRCSKYFRTCKADAHFLDCVSLLK